MANYSIKADLLKLQGAFVTNIKGKTATKQCLCIPIAESGLFLGKQGCYLNLTAIEMQNPRFEDTHCIKVQFDKAIYDNMTEEERRAQPNRRWTPRTTSKRPKGNGKTRSRRPRTSILTLPTPLLPLRAKCRYNPSTNRL